ncbi:MAG: hypothetical protein Ct9H300mP11_14170 [Chloroflexota bacterium]|nr:MAG: hypothetical protein Ct9H300mP11_14170 [Chloroflexota bacterium]
MPFGEVRIGLAVSGLMVWRYQLVISYAPNLYRMFASDPSADTYGAEGIVVGIPYMVNGKAGDSAKLARGFIRALRKETGLASMKWTNALRALKLRGFTGIRSSPSRDRASVDETAAMLILQRYFGVSHRN